MPLKDFYQHRFILGPHSQLSLPFQKLLKRNSQKLLQVKAECPQPAMHRDTLRQVLKLPTADLADKKTHQIYVDAVLDKDDTRCVIYNYGAFLGGGKSALYDEVPYPKLEEKVAPLRILVGEQKATLYICLKTYAEWSTVKARHNSDLGLKLSAAPERLGFSWVPFVERLRSAWPESTLVVLRENELAFHWAAYVALITGHPNAHSFDGIDTFPLSTLANKGKAHLKILRAQSQPKSIRSWINQTMPVVSRFGLQGITQDIGAGGIWTPSQIAQSEDIFEADFAHFQRMDNLIIADKLIGDFQ